MAGRKAIPLRPRADDGARVVARGLAAHRGARPARRPEIIYRVEVVPVTPDPKAAVALLDWLARLIG